MVQILYWYHIQFGFILQFSLWSVVTDAFTCVCAGSSRPQKEFGNGPYHFSFFLHRPSFIFISRKINKKSTRIFNVWLDCPDHKFDISEHSWFAKFTVSPRLSANKRRHVVDSSGFYRKSIGFRGPEGIDPDSIPTALPHVAKKIM